MCLNINNKVEKQLAQLFLIRKRMYATREGSSETPFCNTVAYVASLFLSVFVTYHPHVVRMLRYIVLCSSDIRITDGIHFPSREIPR